MSDIRFRNSQTAILGFECRKILQNKINIVCEKINYSDKDIKWIIFDSFTEYANGKKKKSVYNRVFSGIKNDGSDYAEVDVKNRVVYISIMAVQLDKTSFGFVNHFFGLKGPRTRRFDDKLANILIDEITHLQTERDHGSEEYDRKLRENLKAYYHNWLYG